MKIELLDPKTLVPYAANPRKTDPRKINPRKCDPRKPHGAVEAVAESIRRFGFRKPIVVDGDLVIIAGHVRHQAALKLGLTSVPVHIARDLTPVQVRGYRLADNQTGELAPWDNDKLIDELLDLDRIGQLDSAGFSKAELDVLLQARIPATEAEWDDAFGALPDSSPTHNRQTFTLTSVQKASVLAAAKAVQRKQNLTNPDNPDEVANAIAYMAEVYLER